MVGYPALPARVCDFALTDLAFNTQISRKILRKNVLSSESPSYVTFPDQRSLLPAASTHGLTVHSFSQLQTSCLDCLSVLP